MIGEPTASKAGAPQYFGLYLSTSWVILFAIDALASLRVLDHLGDEPMTVDELASATGTHADTLRRIMNLLTAEGLIGATADGRIFHNDYSRTLRSDHPFSIRAMESIRTHKEAGLWLAEGLRSGRTPYVERFGKSPFEHMAENSQTAQTFAEFMSVTTAWVDRAIFESHRFHRFALAVDVGGSHGSLLLRLLTEYPQAQGILFDLPHVAKSAADRWAGSAIASRVQAVGGSFFESVPEGGDLYLLKQVLHDWTDDACISILRNVRRSMAPNGRVAIVEQIIPEKPAPDPGWVMDVWMMIVTGGRERSLSEYEHLLKAAGLALDRVTSTPSIAKVIEAVAV